MTDSEPEIVELEGGPGSGDRRPVGRGVRTYIRPVLDRNKDVCDPKFHTATVAGIFLQACYDDAGRTTPDGLRVFAYRGDAESVRPSPGS